MAEETTTSPEQIAATNIIKKAITGRTLTDGGMLTAPEVRARVALGFQSSIDDLKAQQEVLEIVVTDPKVATTPIFVRDTVLKSLGELPGLKDKIAFDTDAEHAVKMRARLGDFIKKGADIPPAFLEWGGFKPTVAEKKGWNNDLGTHALNIDKDGLGIHINIKVPLGEDEQPNSKAIIEGIEQNIKGRLPEIRDMLVKRIAKYKGVSDEAGLAAIKQKVDALKIETSTSEYNQQDNYATAAQVMINIASPEQKETSKDPVKFFGLPEDEKKKIAATNILQDLSIEQLGKALGRAFLSAGETSQEIFPKIAGRRDMQIAIIKSLSRLKSAKPEIATEIETFLNDDTFKDHKRWVGPQTGEPTLKSRPSASTSKKNPNEMIFELPLAAGQAQEIIKQLAALETAAPTQEQAADAETPATPVNPIAEILAKGPQGLVPQAPTDGHVNQIAAKRTELAAQAAAGRAAG